MSSPEQPVNSFEKTDVQEDLGVPMDRGFDGIRTHLAELIRIQESTATSSVSEG